MKTRLLNALIAVILFLIPSLNYAQAPTMGTAADFVIFSTVGAVGNTGVSLITGNVGTNNGGVTGFGNVNGVMTFTGSPKSAQCATDLLIAYNQLNATVPTFFPAPLIGNGTILNTGVYSITGAATLNSTLVLDAQNNANATFIFKISGPLSTNANSKIILINGALACNVFWKVEGLVSMGPGTTMRGTVIANNAAINMSAGDTLEGRLLSTAGAVTVTGVLAYTPTGCGSPFLTGPAAPVLSSLACYTILSSSGPVTNVGVTHVTGDVGSNSGLTTGFNPLFVTGTIHPIPDGSTSAAAVDLLTAYTYLNALPYDIELLYPAQFGNNLVLTPHTYLMNGSVTFTDSVFLNAEGNVNAVFIIKVYGAFSTSTYSKVKLINGTKKENVYWMINGAVTINDYSEFVGTIISTAAMSLNTGVFIDGRVLTTVGAINTSAITAIMPPGCAVAPSLLTGPFDQTVCEGDTAMFIITATGTALTYQWRKGNVNLINGGNISGATSDTLIIYPVSVSDADTTYNVIVSGASLPSDTSLNVSLIVNTAPVITLEPVNQAACAGDSAKYFVTATGTGLTYQWRKGNINLINGGNISGANSDTLFINPVNNNDSSSFYNVIVSGTCLPNDTSIFVSLLVNSSPVIITQPVNQIICAGDSVSFFVVATGSGLTYQWRKGTVNLINGGNISGATSDTLTINPATISDTSTKYNVVISGACSSTSTDTSSSSTIVDLKTAGRFGILAGVGISSTGFSEIHNMDVGISPGVRSSIVGFPPAIVVNGAIYASDDIAPPGVPAMLIQAKQDLTDAYLFAEGATAPAPVTISGDQGGLTLAPGIYKSTSTLLIQSGNLTLDGQGNPNASWIFQIAAGFTTVGGAGGSVILTGMAQSKNIFWQVGSSATIGNGTAMKGNIMALTSITINTGASSDGRLLARNGAVVLSGTNIITKPSDSSTTTIGSQLTSINVSLTVNTPPVITSEPLSITVCSGNSASFAVTATGTGLTYQWRKGTVNLINGGSISGATSDTLTINPVNISDASANYNVIVSGTCLPNDTSLFVSLIVNPIPVPVPNSNSPVCSGSSINLTAQTIVGGTYLWNGPNGFVSTSQNPVIPSATIVNAGIYTLTVSALTCTSTPANTTVIINNCATDLSVVKTVNNITPFFGKTVVFTIVVKNNGPYIATGVTVNDILQSGFTFVSKTLTAGTFDPFTGVWSIGTLNNGASATLTVTVTVITNGNYVNTAIVYANEGDNNMSNNVSTVEISPTDFFIPEGFSPNGDGINDKFVIRGILNFPKNTFMIFNRWGNKIYEISPYTNEWDGSTTLGISFGGNALPTGTYFYVLDLGNNTSAIKGTIYLNR